MALEMRVKELDRRRRAPHQPPMIRTRIGKRRSSSSGVGREKESGKTNGKQPKKDVGAGDRCNFFSSFRTSPLASSLVGRILEVLPRRRVTLDFSHFCFKGQNFHTFFQVLAKKKCEGKIKLLGEKSVVVLVPTKRGKRKQTKINPSFWFYLPSSTRSGRQDFQVSSDRITQIKHLNHLVFVVFVVISSRRDQKVSLWVRGLLGLDFETPPSLSS